MDAGAKPTGKYSRRVNEFGEGLGLKHEQSCQSTNNQSILKRIADTQ
jgi:hypothetical protein